METDSRGAVLHLITDDARRGAQVFATQLVEALGGSVSRSLAALASSDADVRLEVPVLGPRRLHPATLWRLRTAMSERRCLVAHGSSTLPASVVAGVGMAVPVVYRQISDSTYWAPSRASRARVRAYYRRTTHVVALHPGAATTLERRFAVSPDKISVIPNGVPRPTGVALTRADARQELGLGHWGDAPVAVSIGALVPEKGTMTSLQSVSRVNGMHLLVVGEGPERPKLQGAAASLGMATRVHFTGALVQPDLAYMAADIHIMPTRGGDSMPAVIAEAAFHGLPTLSTKVGGIPDMLDGGRAGWLVGMDDLAGMQRVLKEVRDNAEAVQAMGKAAHKRAEQLYELNVVARQWARTLAQVTRR